jgi:hypothetical protein
MENQLQMFGDMTPQQRELYKKAQKEERRKAENERLCNSLLNRLNSLKPDERIYKGLTAYVADAAMFVGTFNSRPQDGLYYSEKLLTIEQKTFYENAIVELAEIIEQINK